MNKSFVCSRKSAKELNLIHYFTGKTCRSGHISIRYTRCSTCVECCREQTKKWAEKNPELRKSISNKYASKKRKDKNFYEIALQRTRDWRKSEQVKEYQKLYRKNYYKNNPGQGRKEQNARRARKANSKTNYTLEQIDDLLKKQRFRCFSCLCSVKKKYHIDHIYPLSKGGSNDITNIQILCPSCNLKKQSQDPFLWAKKNGRLL